jgi:hypothetical protein
MRSASWLWGALLLVVAGPALGADAAPGEEAKRAFSAGVILLKDPDGAKYDDALVQFNKAYRLSGSWKALGNVGLCSMKLERDGEAIAAYEKYLAQGGKEVDAEERGQIERDLAALKAQVVQVHIELPQGATRLADERANAHGRVLNEYPLGSSSIQLGMHPGHHLMTVRLASGSDLRWDVDLAPSTTVSHKFESSAAAEPAPVSHQPRTLGWVLGGVGVVGIGVGAAFGLKTFAAKSDSDGYCTGNSCRQPGLDLRNNASTYATISDVAFAVGIAGLGAGAYFLFLRSPTDKPGTGLAIGSSVASGGAGVALRGGF